MWWPGRSILGAGIRLPGTTATPASKAMSSGGSASAKILEASTAMTQDSQSCVPRKLCRAVGSTDGTGANRVSRHTGQLRLGSGAECLRGRANAAGQARPRCPARRADRLRAGRRSEALGRGGYGPRSPLRRPRPSKCSREIRAPAAARGPLTGPLIADPPGDEPSFITFISLLDSVLWYGPYIERKEVRS